MHGDSRNQIDGGLWSRRLLPGALDAEEEDRISTESHEHWNAKGGYVGERGAGDARKQLAPASGDTVLRKFITEVVGDWLKAEGVWGTKDVVAGCGGSEGNMRGTIPAGGAVATGAAAGWGIIRGITATGSTERRCMRARRASIDSGAGSRRARRPGDSGTQVSKAIKFGAPRYREQVGTRDGPDCEVLPIRDEVTRPGDHGTEVDEDGPGAEGPSTGGAYLEAAQCCSSVFCRSWFAYRLQWFSGGHGRDQLTRSLESHQIFPSGV
ncbi:hypothetical protein B0H11DRAFT_1905138 [Mycena galericulata]|nr:hypothetical protein B0H11DRAFT_1905138 [Mycena galericulata]